MVTKPIGKFYGHLNIGKDVFEDDVFVVLPAELILKRTLLDKAEILIRKNTIRRILEDNKDEDETLEVEINTINKKMNRRNRQLKQS